MRRILSGQCVPAIVAGIACAPSAHAVDFSGNATLTSDYVWRGSTQSSGDPAAQAGLRLADEGFYVSAWGSSVKFAPALHASTELDFTVGWGRSFENGWSTDVNVLRYRYPGTTADLDWTELNGTVTWRNNVWLSVGWSNEALGYDHSGVYTQVGARFPLRERFRLEAMLSRYVLSRDVVARSGYTHAQLNAIWVLRTPFELRLSGHVTDASARAIFGDDFAGTRVEAALQAAF